MPLIYSLLLDIIMYISSLSMKKEQNMAIVELTADEYESVVEKSEKPVLIDFWAPWCRNSA